MFSLAKLELWALRSLAVLAAVGLAAWWVFAQGEGHVQRKWDEHEKVAQIAQEVQSAKNRLESTNRQNDVDLAEAQAARAQRDLDAYRRTHPVTGAGLARRLCPEAPDDTARACAGAGNSEAIAACKTSRLLLAQRARDSVASRLDTLLAEADAINDSYAICLSTRPKEP